MKGTDNENRAVALLVVVRAPAGSLADRPKVNRGMIEAMEHSLDNKFAGLWPQDPAEVLGLSQGAYIQGYGAIFLSEVNLAPAAGISPFHPTVSADEIRRTHEKKVQRMAAIRNAMRAMLVDSARSLDSVPADEQVAVRSVAVLLEVGKSRRAARADRDACAAQSCSCNRPAPSQASIAIRRVLSRCGLGEILIQRKLITAEDLERALELQKERGDKIGKTLVDMGFIAMRDVLAALSEQLDVPLVSIDSPPFVSSETEALSPRFLRQFRCLPMSREDHTITLAMADPLDVETIAAVRHCTGLKISTVLAPEQEILDAIDKYYGESAARAEADFEFQAGEMSEDLEHLRDMASEAPVIRLVNAIIASGGGKARQRHPPGAVRKGVPHPLSRGWRALQSGPAAARVEGRHDFARQADGQAQYRRAPPAAGRPHQDQDAGPRSGFARFHVADAVWRKRRDAPARSLGGRFLRSAAGWASTSTC